MAGIKNNLPGIDHEARSGMAAVRALDIDDLGIGTIEFDMSGVEIVLIVGDIGLGDEGMTCVSLDLKVEAGRITGPAWLKGSNGRIDGELWRNGQHCPRADAAAQPDRPVVAHALTVGDDMRIGGCQLTDVAAGLVNLQILILVAVARDEVDCIDTVRVEEGFTEAWTIERVVVGVGIECHDTAGASEQSHILDLQLWASENSRGGRRMDGSDMNAGTLSM